METFNRFCIGLGKPKYDIVALFGFVRLPGLISMLAIVVN